MKNVLMVLLVLGASLFAAFTKLKKAKVGKGPDTGYSSVYNELRNNNGETFSAEVLIGKNSKNVGKCPHSGKFIFSVDGKERYPNRTKLESGCFIYGLVSENTEPEGVCQPRVEEQEFGELEIKNIFARKVPNTSFIPSSGNYGEGISLSRPEDGATIRYYTPSYTLNPGEKSIVYVGVCIKGSEDQQ